MMRLKRLLWGALIALCLLLMLVASLLLTHTGNQWLWGLAKKQVDGLDGTLVSGQLLSGWEFSELAYEQDSLAFRARQVTLDWQLGKVVDGRFWLRRLEAADIDVEIREFAEGEPEPDAESTPLGAISPPLNIELDDIRAERVNISLPGQRISWKSLQVAARWNQDGMVITGPQMSGLRIELESTGEATADAGPANSTDRTAITLPEIRLPFPLKIEQLALTDSTLVQNGQLQALSRLALALEGEGSRIRIERLALAHAMADASLTGEVTLSGDYPLSASLNATLHEPLLDGQLKGQTLALTLNDSLANLAADLSLKGPVAARARLKAEPLKPELPLDLTLSWQQLGWPLTDPQWTLTQGELKLAGALEDYRLTLNTEAGGPELPPVGIALAATGNLQQARIEPLTLVLPQGETRLTGDIGWTDGVRWQGELTLNEVDPGAFAAGFEGRLNGRINSRFELSGEQWQLEASPEVTGLLRNHPLSLTGALSLNQDLEGEIDNLLLANGNNRLAVAGRIDQNWALKGSLNAPKLAVYAPGLFGDIQGDFNVTSVRAAPRVRASLAGNRAGFNDTEARQLALNADVTLGEAPAGELTLTVNRLNVGSLRFDDLALSADGDKRAHQLTLTAEGEPLALDLALNGSLNEQGWNGRLQRAELNTPLEVWRVPAPVALAWRQSDGVFNAAAHCWRSNGAGVCLDELNASAKEGQAGLTINDFDLARLKPFLPDDFAWEAVLEGRANVRWQQGEAPRVNAQIGTTAGTFVSGDTRLGYDRLQLQSEVVNNRLVSELAFDSEPLGRMRLNARVNGLDAARNLDGELTIQDLRLDWLTPLLPEVARLQGSLAGDVRLAGTLTAPLMYGDISLTGGEVDTYADMVKVRDLTTRLTVQGNRAVVNGQLRVGEGPLNIDGELDWSALPVSGEIRLKGSELEAGYPGMGRVKVSPDLQITLGEQARVRGDILIPWARIKVKELPESAVRKSSDVVIVQPSGVVPDITPTLPLDIRVRVRLGEDVRLEAFGLNTHLTGQLRVVQPPGRIMRANGEIRLEQGRFKAYGQNLLIRDGSILFSGPLDQPNLRVEAIRNPSSMADSSIVVGVRVSGSATQPELEVFSEPGMPQAEQLSWLLRGRGLEGGDETDGNALVQSMLLGAGVGKVGGLVTGVGEALGFQDVAVDTSGSGENTAVNISAYVLPGLQIGYGVGVFSSIGELRLRYELLPRLYLQATSGLSQAIDLFYKFEF
ncbi:translocation/assembly module TamB domain-containing protein [Oceanimonas sp. CHS3-5]|uniref:autotransporter assembly complex protein TamB n=1 Tax=Oceanimonas sp. CHS3-5 TaxID=3068186 RepID=UPI00273D6566|nr:translocation/assembly module TamB domain-containing protein [Oceanimonas sp. CHS3-5]MDP5291342.1 translocation/assembly module TamB domain-containing protein [Oceanimonas sp. CHS3-5]